MIRHLHFLLLLLMGLLNSCQKELPYGGSTDEEKGLVATARDYFEENVATLRFPVMGSPFSEEIATRHWDGEVIVPSWDKVTVYSDARSSAAINLPLNYGVTRYAAKSYVGRKGDLMAENTPWHSHVSIEKAQGGGYSMMVVTIIPEWRYANKNAKKLKDINLYNADDYSGYMLFSSLEGEFLYGYIYVKGVKKKVIRRSTSSASKCSCEHQHDEDGSGDSEHRHNNCGEQCEDTCDNNCAGEETKTDSLPKNRVRICLHQYMDAGWKTRSESNECKAVVSPGFECPLCGQFHEDYEIEEAEIIYCRRCGQKLQKYETCTCCGECGGRGNHKTWCSFFGGGSPGGGGSDPGTGGDSGGENPGTPDGGGGSGKPPGTGNPGGGNVSVPDIAPNAKRIFRNANMTEENWRLLERMLNKIIADCLGGALYNGLASFLGGSTFAIQFDFSARTSTFDGNGIMLNCTESNSLFHEMFHGYQAYNETLESFEHSKANIEIEANIAQYRYVSKLPEYTPGSKWAQVYEKGFGREIARLSEYLSISGELNYQEDLWDFNNYFAAAGSKVIAEYAKIGQGLFFDYDRSLSENLSNLIALSKGC